MLTLCKFKATSTLFQYRERYTFKIRSSNKHEYCFFSDTKIRFKWLLRNDRLFEPIFSPKPKKKYKYTNSNEELNYMRELIRSPQIYFHIPMK